MIIANLLTWAFFILDISHICVLILPLPRVRVDYVLAASRGGFKQNQL